MSAKKSRSPPDKKPIEVINQGFKFNSLLVSMAGAKSEKYEAAIITPAAKPSIASITFLLIFLKKKTIDAPNRVTKYVKIVANRA